MKPSILLHLITSTALIVSVASAAAEDNKRDPFQPILLAKGEDSLVHAIPVPRGLEDYINGHHIVHTVPSTGKMRVLVKSGTWSRETRIAMFFYDRILGVVADERFLYVLTWSSGRIYDKPPVWSPGDPIYDFDGTFSLQVFNLSDGTRKVGRPVKKFKKFTPPNPIPVEKLNAGPMKIGKRTVSFYGINFEERSFREELGSDSKEYERTSPSKAIDSDRK